jgi:hypothetical protein
MSWTFANDAGTMQRGPRSFTTLETATGEAPSCDASSSPALTQTLAVWRSPVLTDANRGGVSNSTS